MGGVEEDRKREALRLKVEEVKHALAGSYAKLVDKLLYEAGWERRELSLETESYEQFSAKEAGKFSQGHDIHPSKNYQDNWFNQSGDIVMERVHKPAVQ